eukprot:m51a1_g4256 hypothetical protein (1543) ;mRNA; f:222420-231623
MAAFAFANETMPLKFALASLDDAYDDARQQSNVEQLLCTGANGMGPAFAIAGSVGSSASEAALKVLLSSAGSDGVPVPFVGSLASSQVLRNRSVVLQNTNSSTTNWRTGVVLARAGGEDELTAILQFLMSAWDYLNNTSIFYEDSSLGLLSADYLGASLRALGATLHSSYKVPAGTSVSGLSSMAKDAVRTLCSSGNPKTVVLVAQASMSGALIEEIVAQNKTEIIFVATAVVTADELYSALPQPTEYQKAMAKHQPGMNLSHASLEGFIAGRLITTAASRALELNDWPLTRANFLDSIFRDVRTFRLHDYTLGPYGDGVGTTGVAQTADDWCNQGAHQVFMTLMDHATGQLESLDSFSLKFSGCSVAKWNSTSSVAIVGFHTNLMTLDDDDFEMGLSAASSAHNSDSSKAIANANVYNSLDEGVEHFKARKAVAMTGLRDDELSSALEYIDSDRVVNLFASYYQEARTAAAFLINEVQVERIVVLWSSASTYFNISNDFVEGMKLCSSRNLSNVNKFIDQIEYIADMTETIPQGDNWTHVYRTSLTPPLSMLPSSNALRKDMESWASSGSGQNVLEGFFVGKFISAVIQSMLDESSSVEVTAETLLHAIYTKRHFKIDNKFTVGPFLDQSSGERLCNQGMDTVYVTKWSQTDFNYVKFSVDESRRCGLEFEPQTVTDSGSNSERTVILSTIIPGFAIACSLILVAVVAKSRGRSTLKKIKRSELEIGNRIGKGQFGTVHNGDWHGTPVAIRVIDKTAITPEDLEAVKSEMTLLAKFMASGSLHEYLKKNKQNMNYYNQVAIAFYGDHIKTRLGMCDPIHGSGVVLVELCSKGVELASKFRNELDDLGAETQSMPQPAQDRRAVEQRRLELRRRNEAEADERIAAHERAKRQSPAGADKQTTLVRNDLGQLEEVPDISPRWVPRTPGFVTYLPPGVGDAEDAAAAEAMLEDARALSEAPYKQFWSTAAHELSFARFVDCYLRYHPRAWERRAAGLDAQHRSLYARMFVVLQRLCTDRESDVDYLNRETYVSIVREKRLVDVPKVLDICALYGPACPAGVAALVQRLFAAVPQLWDDLERAVPEAVAALDLQRSTSSGGSLPDALVFVRDTAATLASVARVFPPVTHVLSNCGVVERMPGFFDELRAVDCGADRALGLVRDDAVQFLVSLACSVVGHAFLDVLEGTAQCPRCTAASREAEIELLLSFLEAHLTALPETATPEDTLVLALASRLPLSSRLLSVASACAGIADPERIRYYSALLKERVGEDVQASPSETPSSASASATPTPAQTPTPSGASRTPSPGFPKQRGSTPDITASLVAEVLDLFPDADTAAVLQALRSKGNNVEAVVAGVLDGQISLAPPKGQVKETKEARGAKGAREAGRPAKAKEDKGVYYVGKMPLNAPGLNAGEMGANEKTAVKRTTLAAVERMEEEREKEIERGLEYEDEYDDSFDDFVRYGFRDGAEAEDEADAVKEGSSESDDDSQQRGAPGPAQGPAAAQGQQQQQQHKWGNGGPRSRAPFQHKAHHQKDRALRKRTKLWS